MAKNYFDIALAPPGVFQSARLVQQLAHPSQCEVQSLRVSLQSLLDLNPPAGRTVYGENPTRLHMGLETLQGVLNAQARERLGGRANPLYPGADGA